MTPSCAELIAGLRGLKKGRLPEVLRAWLSGRPAFPDLTELDGLFRSGSASARLAALELCLMRRADWGKRWGGLFLRWARAEDSSDAVAETLGARLLGPLWLSGELEARQMVALSMWEGLWPWRTGLSALEPSLARDGSDWPLFEQFAKACVPQESRFHAVRAAHKGVLRALRAGFAGCPEKVRAFVDRLEPELPGFVVAGVRAKTGELQEEAA